MMDFENNVLLSMIFKIVFNASFRPGLVLFFAPGTRSQCCYAVDLRYAVNRFLVLRLMHVDSVPLLIIVVSIIVDNVEEPKLVDTFAHADYPQPIPQLLLLEEFLGPAIAFD